MSLAALEILEEAQFPPAQARAIARVFEAEAAARADQLATKADLAQLEARIDIKFEKFRSEFDLKLGEIMVQLGVQIEGVKTECVRWTFLAMVGQVSMLAGIMYFMLQHLR
jgi:hypothetical protein